MEEGVARLSDLSWTRLAEGLMFEEQRSQRVEERVVMLGMGEDCKGVVKYLTALVIIRNMKMNHVPLP